jgi:murein DD-endopeptidase MepM/ murein hydrolase activator NlpD
MRLLLVALLRPLLLTALVPLTLLPVVAVPAVGAPTAIPATESSDPVGEWPLRPEPEVVHPFAPPADPWGPGHRGVDLAGHAGQQVRAALPGRVSFAGRLAGRGVVTVDHGDTRTTYEPVAATVAVGARVTAGEPIGRLEVPLGHCFPAACLHWGWLRGDTYLDPLGLVGHGPVRLLPLWRDSPVALRGAPAAPAARPTVSPYASWSSQAQRAGWLP